MSCSFASGFVKVSKGFSPLSRPVMNGIPPLARPSMSDYSTSVNDFSASVNDFSAWSLAGQFQQHSSKRLTQIVCDRPLPALAQPFSE